MLTPSCLHGRPAAPSSRVHAACRWRGGTAPRRQGNQAPGSSDSPLHGDCLAVSQKSHRGLSRLEYPQSRAWEKGWREAVFPVKARGAARREGETGLPGVSKRGAVDASPRGAVLLQQGSRRASSAASPGWARAGPGPLLALANPGPEAQKASRWLGRRRSWKGGRDVRPQRSRPGGPAPEFQKGG